MTTSNNTSPDDQGSELESIRNFYDSVYYKDAKKDGSSSSHYEGLASRVGITAGERVLDVACGLGRWLSVCERRGAIPSGIDLSERAIDVCRQTMPEGTFFAQPAEKLPFESGTFDVVTCLGSLEHFVDQESAVREMVRVARPNARLVILVPNQGFLTRRLGLYDGTYQTAAKEVVRTLTEWTALFERCGLTVDRRWRDLHVLAWNWINSRGLARAPVRAAQAAALAVWPLEWQYQVYHLCSIRR